MTLMQKRPVARIPGHVSDVRAGQNSINGGSSETDVTEFAAMPSGPAGPHEVMTVTPVGSLPRTWRKVSEAIRVTATRAWWQSLALSSTTALINFQHGS
jgi:hypothetical protein